MNRRVVLVALEVATPVLLVSAWWAASAGSESMFFPPLSAMVAKFAENWLGERLGSDLLPSVARMLAGYLVAAVAGVLIGIVLGSSHLSRRLAEPAVSFLRSIPGAALLPPAVLVFGVGHTMKVAIIAFVCLWPVLLNTVDGIDETDATMQGTAAVFAIRGLRKLVWVTLPAASPRIVAGLRTSLALAVIMVVISEMVASTGGLGYFILYAQRTFAVTDMWSGIIMLGLLGYVLNLAFTLLERRVLAWRLAQERRG